MAEAEAEAVAVAEAEAATVAEAEAEAEAGAATVAEAVAATVAAAAPASSRRSAGLHPSMESSDVTKHKVGKENNRIGACSSHTSVKSAKFGSVR